MTLTETAAATKRGLRITLIFGSIFLVLWLIFLFVYNNVWVPYQKTQTKPEQRFGPVQKPKFPTSLASTSIFEYSLDTNSGTLPTGLPRLLNVYFIPPQETSLLAPDRARRLADSLNFTSDPLILSPNSYRYSDQDGGQLTIDLSTGNFSYSRVIPASSPNGQPLLQDPVLGQESELVAELTSLLFTKGLLLPNFQKPRSLVSYDNPNRQMASTAQVSIWPNNIGDFPIVTDNPSVGPISTTMTKYLDQNLKFSKLSYSVWSFDSQTFSTYAIKPINQVFEDFKSGQGVVIKNTTQGSKVSVTKIYLAYYLSSQYQPYLEPIYVFEGDNFTAYIPALTDDSYAK